MTTYPSPKYDLFKLSEEYGKAFFSGLCDESCLNGYEGLKPFEEACGKESLFSVNANELPAGFD